MKPAPGDFGAYGFELLQQAGTDAVAWSYRRRWRRRSPSDG
ncbi:hypothetical protein [Streptomyces sp. NPDC126933]